MSKDLSSNDLPPKQQHRSLGFTLVEMLVIAPLAMLTIAVLVMAMIGMISDALLSQRGVAGAYGLQDALDKIEADTRMSSAFLDTFKLLPAGQGRSATVSNMTDTTQFDAEPGNATPTKGDLILSSPATTSNPFDANRRIVYYRDQPNACNGAVYMNRVLSTKIIYFTLDDGKGVGTKTLWRRTILPDWNQNATPNTQTVCDRPWQRDSCPRIAAPNCAKADEKMLENVTNFRVTYYTSAQIEEKSTVRNADSIKVTLSVKENLAGKSIDQSGSMVTRRTAGTSAEIPQKPVVYVDGAEDNTMNNPRKSSFAWQSTAFGGLYTVRYSTNAGSSWSAPVDTASNKLTISTWPGDSVRVEVIAKNDMGSSDPQVFSYTTPRWTTINLTGDWQCFDPASNYACPQYTMTKSGVVLYKGMAKGGADGSTMFVLPPEMEPAASKVLAFNSLSDNQPGRIDINAYLANVSVVWRKVDPASSSDYVTLDNIIYPTSTTALSASWASASLTTNGWKHMSTSDSNWGNVEYAKDTVGRTWIRGGACGSTNIAVGSQVFTLPSGFQEHATLTGVHLSQGATTFTAVQLTGGASSQLQTFGSGTTSPTCPGGFMNFNLMYHSTTSTTAFSTPAFYGTWQNNTGTYTQFGAQKATMDNIVSLRGRIRDSTSPTTYTSPEKIATLASGYRPVDTRVFYVAGQYASSPSPKQGPMRIEIRPTGEIYLINMSTYPPNGVWLSLEDIHFYADGS